MEALSSAILFLSAVNHDVKFFLTEASGPALGFSTYRVSGTLLS